MLPKQPSGNSGGYKPHSHAVAWAALLPPVAWALMHFVARTPLAGVTQ